MAAHSHVHHSPSHDHDAETGLADLLDLDAEVHDEYLAQVTWWVGEQVRGAPRTIVDLGAGTGSGSLALARRFTSADVIAVDKSMVMLDRVLAAARDQELADRVRVMQADLDVGLPEVGPVDLVWAASSLHEVADPERVLSDIYAALNRGGLFVVAEMDALPRFLPEDSRLGRRGLEVRCQAALADSWNVHPNWRSHLERAGFTIAAERTFTVEASLTTPNARRYAHAYLRRMRSALDGQLDADDLDTLDHLLEEDGIDGVLRRHDLTVRGSRTGWAARRP